MRSGAPFARSMPVGPNIYLGTSGPFGMSALFGTTVVHILVRAHLLSRASTSMSFGSFCLGLARSNSGSFLASILFSDV